MTADRPSHFNLAGAGDPFDELLQQVRGAAEGVYDILGEMGRSQSGNVVYLARELDTQHLVALKLTRTANNEYALEVLRTLDSNVPGLESSCPECNAVLPDWDRFCFQCGADLSRSTATVSPDEADQLLEAVREATADEYDILGQMDRAGGGGLVFFARDRQRDKLVALRLKRDEGADEVAYSIGETQVLRPLAAELGRTQVLGAMGPPSVRQPAPPPPPPVSAAPSVPVEPSPSPARPAGGPRSGPPLKLILGGAGVLALVLVGWLVFGGGGGDPVPAPAPTQLGGQTPVDPSPVPDPDTLGFEGDSVTPAPEPAPAPPPPVVTPVDSGVVRLAVNLPSGAVFAVNGTPVRGSSIRLPVGRHRLSLVVAGLPPVTERVTVSRGRTLAWSPTIPTEPSPTPAPAPPPPPPPQPTATCARSFARSDWGRAADLCLAEANAGGREAQRLYARMRELGNGVQQDRAQAASWYAKAAAAGDVESQVRLGYLYRNGLGVKKDERESARWFSMAANQGSREGLLEYGVALENGDGVNKDESQAADYYRRAADKGSAAATRQLGRLYERGRGVSKDEAAAAKLYEEGFGKGDAEAGYLLGRMYKDGRGVAKSPELALEWFKKAAALGHRQAAEEARKLER